MKRRRRAKRNVVEVAPPHDVTVVLISGGGGIREVAWRSDRLGRSIVVPVVNETPFGDPTLAIRYDRTAAFEDKEPGRYYYRETGTQRTLYNLGLDRAVQGFEDLLRRRLSAGQLRRAIRVRVADMRAEKSIAEPYSTTVATGTNRAAIYGGHLLPPIILANCRSEMLPAKTYRPGFKFSKELLGPSRRHHARRSRSDRPRTARRRKSRTTKRPRHIKGRGRRTRRK